MRRRNEQRRIEAIQKQVVDQKKVADDLRDKISYRDKEFACVLEDIREKADAIALYVFDETPEIYVDADAFRFQREIQVTSDRIRFNGQCKQLLNSKYTADVSDAAFLIRTSTMLLIKKLEVLISEKPDIKNNIENIVTVRIGHKHEYVYGYTEEWLDSMGLPLKELAEVIAKRLTDYHSTHRMKNRKG